MMNQTIYDYTVRDATGREVNMGEMYRGKVVIMVNVASECGAANEQYLQLRELWTMFHDRGMEIAAFPCNQFLGQEPGPEIDIKDMISQKYAFAPDVYAKVKVNGDDGCPLWKFLKHSQGGTLVDTIKWNFTKFLISKHGIVLKRYGPTTDPKEMTADIERALMADSFNQFS